MVYTEFALTLYRMENKAFTLQLLNQKKKKTLTTVLTESNCDCTYAKQVITHTLLCFGQAVLTPKCCCFVRSCWCLCHDTPAVTRMRPVLLYIAACSVQGECILTQTPTLTR